MPFSSPNGAFSPSINPFTVDSNGSGGACAATPPFSLAQATSNQTSTAGGHTSFTFALGRNDGNQYVSKVQTTLPAGLVGAIPTATQCGEAESERGLLPGIEPDR